MKDYWEQRKGNSDNPWDFHPTPDDVTESLIARERFQGVIHEPASGDGAVMRVLRKAGTTRSGASSPSTMESGDGPSRPIGSDRSFVATGLRVAQQIERLEIPAEDCAGVQAEPRLQ